MSEKTFNNTNPTELVWMNKQNVIDLISNKFPSKILSDDKDWTIIESDWCILDTNNEMNSLRFEENINTKFKVYFHISEVDFCIIRSDNTQSLKSFLEKATQINPNIINTKYDNGELKSLILEGQQFQTIQYSFAPIPKGKEIIKQNNNHYTLNGMMCDSDMKLHDKPISYYSDLLIGSMIQVKLQQEIPIQTL